MLHADAEESSAAATEVLRFMIEFHLLAPTGILCVCELKFVRRNMSLENMSKIPIT